MDREIGIWELILLGVVAAVIYLLFRRQPATQLAGVGAYIPAGDTPLLGSTGAKMLQAPKETRMLALTLSVKSEPERLPNGKPAFGELRVSADSGNAGDVYIADTAGACRTGPRFTIEAGDSMPIKASELSKLYYFGTAGDQLSIFAEVEERVS
jgi:hypothetical protein